MKIKMKKKDDPKTLFEQVAAVKNWYETGTKKLPKGQLIAVILKAAPDAYASVLTGEQQKRGSGLEMTHLRIVMNKYYRKVYKQSSEKDEAKMKCNWLVLMAITTTTITTTTTEIEIDLDKGADSVGNVSYVTKRDIKRRTVGAIPRTKTRDPVGLKTQRLVLLVQDPTKARNSNL